MTDLILKGPLNLMGSLKLAADGGKVMVNEAEILVEVGRSGKSQGMGIPVIQPPPPAPKPIDDGSEVRIFNSFNSRVTIKVNGADIRVVALGLCIQGNLPGGTWPGMVLPSMNNRSLVTINQMPVTINQIPINVKGDQGITLVNGGTINFTDSGQ